MTNKEKHHTPKLKKLQRLMISWAEHQVDGEKRDLPKSWKPDFKYLLQLENWSKLTRKEMQKCNEIYKYYGDPKGILRNVR